MRILIDITAHDWMDPGSFRQRVPGIPDRDIRFYPEFGDPEKIAMLACDRLRPGLVQQLPNLMLIQKLGAGVDTMLADPDLGPDIRVARLRHPGIATEMARYCVALVTGDMHHLDHFRGMQGDSMWMPVAPKRPEDLRVGVLGLGHIGAVIARMFADTGLQVLGWSRTPKALEGIDCVSGESGLAELLSACDYISCVLPSTPETSGLLNMDRFRSMKAQSMLINIGRGSLLIESDLLEALDRGYLRRAVLDVFTVEPLPKSSRLWHHPCVTVTPHVSGWHVEEGLKVVEDNFRRLMSDMPILNEINRDIGY